MTRQQPLPALVIFTFVLTLATAGCGEPDWKKAGVEPSSDRAKKIVVKVSYKKKAGPGEALVSVSSRGLKLFDAVAVDLKTGKAILTFSADPGTTLKFQGKAWKSAAGKTSWKFTLDILGVSWDWPYEKLKRFKMVELPLQASHPKRKSFKAFIQLFATTLLDRALQGVAKGPVLAPGEKPDGPHKAIYVMEWKHTGGKKNGGYGYSRRGAVGSVKRYRDFTAVAFIRRLAKKKRHRSCGTYRGSRSGTTRRIRNTGVDSRVEVYDRRSGKLLKKKIIRAKIAPCSRVIKGHGKMTYVKPEAIDRWLQKIQKQLKK